MLVSIIVPVYNVEKYISKCLDSLVNQTYKNIEIIIVNDRTKDNCDEIVRRYLHDKRINYIINEVNSGLSESRNNGLNVATGDYLMFVDSDDVLELNAVEILVSELKKQEFDYIIFNATTITEDDDIILSPSIKYSSILSDKDNHVLGPQFAWSKIYKRSLFDNVKFPKGVNYEDLATMPIVLFGLDNFELINKALYRYRIRMNSITGSVNKNQFDIYKSCEVLYSREIEKNGILSDEVNFLIYLALKSKLMSIRHIFGVKNRFLHVRFFKKYLKKLTVKPRKTKYYKLYMYNVATKKFKLFEIISDIPMMKYIFALFYIDIQKTRNSRIEKNNVHTTGVEK